MRFGPLSVTNLGARFLVQDPKMCNVSARILGDKNVFVTSWTYPGVSLLLGLNVDAANCGLGYWCSRNKF